MAKNRKRLENTQYLKWRRTMRDNFRRLALSRWDASYGFFMNLAREYDPDGILWPQS